MWHASLVEIIAMTPLEKRGRRWFLILAGIIILWQLLGVGFALSGGFAEVKWYKSVIKPLGFCVAVAALWFGDNWLRWLVGIACALEGVVVVFISGRVLFHLAEVTPAEQAGFFMQTVGYPVGMVAVLGVVYLAVGLSFMFLPSMRAFFKYQREGQRTHVEVV